MAVGLAGRSVGGWLWWSKSINDRSEASHTRSGCVAYTRCGIFFGPYKLNFHSAAAAVEATTEAIGHMPHRGMNEREVECIFMPNHVQQRGGSPNNDPLVFHPFSTDCWLPGAQWWATLHILDKTSNVSVI